MASTRKKATRTSKRKMIDQNSVNITTNATLSAIECEDDNKIQTIQNTDLENQRDRHTNEQVSCKNETLPLSNKVINLSDKQRTFDMINHNDTENMRQNNSIIESGGVTDFISITDRQKVCYQKHKKRQR